MKFLRQFFAAGFYDASAQDHVCEIWWIVFEQFVVVSNNQQAHFVMADFVDRLAGKTNGVGIQTRIGFVQDGKLWL